MLDRKTLARLLGGRVNRYGAIEAPFPGSQNRFEVRLNPGAPDGFTIFGVGAVERELAYEHVREKLRARALSAPPS